MKRIVSICLIFAMILSLSSCCLQHEWEDADCVTPKTCSKCGKTEGEPLGHDWVDATCTEPKTCKRCKVTEGNPNGHTEGEWEVIEEARPGVAGERTMHCAVCGEELKTEEIEPLPVVSNGSFRISAKTFYYSLMSKISDDLVVGDATNTSGTYAVAIGTKNHDIVSKILFSFGDEVRFVKGNNSDEIGYDIIAISVNHDYLEEFVTALDSIIEVIEPSLTSSERKSLIADKILDMMIDVYTKARDNQSIASGSVSDNGITYSFGATFNEDLLTIQVD